MRKAYLIMLSLLLISMVSAAPIQLNTIAVNFSDTWDFGKKNFVYVYAYDTNNTLVDASNVVIELVNTNNVSYTPNKVFRTSVGTYQRSFEINKTENVTEFLFNVTVMEQGKIINEVHNVTLEGGTDLDKIVRTSKKYLSRTWENFGDYLKDYWLPGLIIVFALLTFVVFIDLFLRRRKQ